MVAIATEIEPVREKVRLFYVWMAAACAVVAFGGFAPTYWLQLSAGTFVGSPLVHIHGVLFSSWTLLLLSQTLLIANGRVLNHRAWGLAGISLATAMVFMGLAAAIQTLTVGLRAGYGDHSRAFLDLAGERDRPVRRVLHCGDRNRPPEAHKRLMLLATITLLQAAMARIFFVLITGGGPGLRPGLGPPPPLAIGLVPSLITGLLIVAGLVYDWRTRGRPHPVWLIGAAVTTAVILLRGPLGSTHGWLEFADGLARITG